MTSLEERLYRIEEGQNELKNLLLQLLPGQSQLDLKILPEKSLQATGVHCESSTTSARGTKSSNADQQLTHSWQQHNDSPPHVAVTRRSRCYRTGGREESRKTRLHGQSDDSGVDAVPRPQNFLLLSAKRHIPTGNGGVPKHRPALRKCPSLASLLVGHRNCSHQGAHIDLGE